tara:strand:- start:259 stop:435 length:177 start_codon:yes stop_codon:yes gene_type:complete
MTKKYSPGFLPTEMKNMLKATDTFKRPSDEFNKDDRDIRRFMHSKSVSLKPAIKKLIK